MSRKWQRRSPSRGQTEREGSWRVRLPGIARSSRAIQPGREVGPQPGPSRSLVTAPASQSAHYGRRVPGSCFHYLEMGHLKGSCPKLGKQYPLSEVKQVEVIISTEGIDKVLMNVESEKCSSADSET